MIWSDFNVLVRNHLGIHGRRQGVQTQIDTLIKAAVMDLQSSIPELRKGNEDTIGPAAFTPFNFAATYKLAPKAVITDLYTQSIDDPTKIARYLEVPLTGIPELRAGKLGIHQYAFAYEPASGLLTVSPDPNVINASVIITWDSQFAEYDNATDVPFDPVVAEAVAAYVWVVLAAQVDKNPAESQRNSVVYRQKKRRIFGDYAEAALVRARFRRASVPASASSASTGEFNTDFTTEFD